MGAAIGYSRLIKHAVTEKASVVQDLFGGARRHHSGEPDWTGIWPQVLTSATRQSRRKRHTAG